MSIRAVIFDVYGTLLKVVPPPSDADGQWENLFLDLLGLQPSLSHIEFCRQCEQIVSRRHAQSRAQGITYPEICWPTVVMEVLPAVADLSEPKRNEFLLRQVGLGRSLCLAEHAAECLRQIKSANLVMGIASNAQAYTLTELNNALSGEGLDLSLFDSAQRFWSFEHGFSKPDPYVFRILTARLEARGIKASETLMIGDRLDNDVEPARAFGWQAWQLQLHRKQAAEMSGDWQDLSIWLSNH